MALFDFLRRPGDKARFATALLARLAERMAGLRAHIDSAAFALVVDDGENTVSLPLGGAYTGWAAHPHRGSIGALDTAIDGVFGYNDPEEFGADLPTWNEVAPDLLPFMVNRADFLADELFNPPANPDEGFIYSVFAERFVFVVSFPEGEELSFVDRGLLGFWGRDWQSVINQALLNLDDTSDEPAMALADGGYGVVGAPPFAPSLLLLAPRFASLPLKGDPVCFITGSSALTVLDSADAAGIDEYARFLAAEEPPPGALGLSPLILQDGEWSLYWPTDPTGAAVRDLHQRQALADAAKLKAAYDEFHAGKPNATQVSPLRALNTERGILTATDWPAGPSTLTPQADLLTFAGAAPFTRRWSDVETLCGPFLPETHPHPPLYDLPQLPPDRLEAIRALPEPEELTGAP